MLQACMFVSVMLRMEEEGLECWVERKLITRIPDVKVAEAGRREEMSCCGQHSQTHHPQLPPLRITNSSVHDTRYLAPKRGQAASTHHDISDPTKN